MPTRARWASLLPRKRSCRYPLRLIAFKVNSPDDRFEVRLFDGHVPNLVPFGGLTDQLVRANAPPVEAVADLPVLVRHNLRALQLGGRMRRGQRENQRSVRSVLLFDVLDSAVVDDRAVVDDDDPPAEAFDVG